VKKFISILLIILILSTCTTPRKTRKVTHKFIYDTIFDSNGDVVAVDKKERRKTANYYNYIIPLTVVAIVYLIVKSISKKQ
jgi:uncharacterized lipoprotein YajG